MRLNFRDVFTNLYEDSERRKRKAKSLSTSPKRGAFHPNISASQKIIVGDTHKFPIRERKKIKEDKMQVDPVTGQLLFSPVILRGPHSKRKKNSEPIGDYLYKKAKSSARSSRDNSQIKNFGKPNILTKKKTEEMISNMRIITFSTIFSLLDTDNDGVIKTESLNTSSKIPIYYRIIKGGYRNI